jgi:hypothetical protein
VIINPFYFLFYLYFFANTYAFINIQMYGGFEVFGEFRQIENTSSLTAYLYQLFFLLLIWLFYKLFSSKEYRVFKLGNGWGVFIVFLTALFFLFNEVTGSGRAGSGFTFEGKSAVNIFFVLLQPDLLFLLIAPFLISNRLFWVALILYFFSLMSRGWMGSVLLVLVVYFVRYYPVKIKPRNFIYYLGFAFCVFFSLPLLDALKWGMRIGLSFQDIAIQLLQDDYWDLMFIVVNSVVDRFQNINYAAYAVQNSSFLYGELMAGKFSWFFQNGIFNSIYCKFFPCAIDFNSYVAELLYGEDGLSWNIDPGLTAWAAIFGYGAVLFIFVVMIMMVVSFGVYASSYGGAGVLLISCFCLLYLFHGWLGAFFNVVVYALGMYLIFRVKLRFK